VSGLRLPHPVLPRLRLARPAWPGRLLSLAIVVVLLGVGAFLAARPSGLTGEKWVSRPVAELEALARRDPSHAGAHLGLGIQYARAGDVQRAVAALERCRALAPDCMEAYAALGEIARHQGDDRRAAEMFSAAVRLDPAFTEGYLHAANAFTQMQGYREARPLAAVYSRRRPDDWKGPFLLGMISAGEGKMPEALSHYEEAVRGAPSHAPAYLNAGATYLYGHTTPEGLTSAADWFRRGLELAPRYPELHYYLGLARFRQRRWQDAAESLRQAVTLKPSLTEAYYPLAQSLRRLGKNAEARLCLDLYTRNRKREAAGK
jgi:tetratricopeptide (TPR) repeat protein